MSYTTENYLKILYTKQVKDTFVKASIMAEKLGVSTAAITDMFKKLSQDKLITYSPYKGAKLTKSGRDIGQNMVRRHRIWELYLQEVVGISWDKVHDEAERLEHASSNDLIDRLEKILNYPQFDPHGDPIPGRDGRMPKMSPLIPLSKLGIHQKGAVKRINDHDTPFLTYIKDLGIQLGTQIEVQDIREFDRSRLIIIGEQSVNISEFTAQNMFIGDVS